MHIEWGRWQPGWHGKPMSAHTAAARLNQLRIESPRGFSWHASCLIRMVRRLGLHHLLMCKPRGGRKKSRAVR
jgi:hypothetical protein